MGNWQRVGNTFAASGLTTTVTQTAGGGVADVDIVTVTIPANTLTIGDIVKVFRVDQCGLNGVSEAISLRYELLFDGKDVANGNHGGTKVGYQNIAAFCISDSTHFKASSQDTAGLFTTFLNDFREEVIDLTVDNDLVFRQRMQPHATVDTDCSVLMYSVDIIKAVG